MGMQPHIFTNIFRGDPIFQHKPAVVKRGHTQALDFQESIPAAAYKKGSKKSWCCALLLLK
jgi:hypothetical protein